MNIEFTLKNLCQPPIEQMKNIEKDGVGMVGSVSQGSGNGLYDMLRSLQKEQEESLEAASAVSVVAQSMETVSNQAAASHSASSNLMSRNFASADREQSKYVQATLIGMKASQQMNDQQQSTLTSILQTAKMEYENATTLGEKYKALKRAEKKISWHQSDEVRKSAEETHLKKSKEELEEKAQEAAAPKDENGNPIEGLPTESAGEAAPMPEISGSNPAPAADVSAAPAPAPAPDVAAAPAPMPEVSAPAAPSAPSINITV